MKQIQIDKSRMIFTAGGKPFFYLADTAWMAFSNMSVEEWDEYTDFRKVQGFTALQISILTILNDTSIGEETLLPFAMDGGKMDFSARNETYFEKAVRMVDIMSKKGLVPALVVLWNNYIPGTWASEHTGNISLMPESFLPEYAACVASCFNRFNPVYIISGDTLFDTETVTRYYSIMLEEIKKQAPDALTTMHLSPRAEIPPAIRDSKSLDFYMFQSGHGDDDIGFPVTLAEKFRSYAPARPVVNGEPCYEGHAYGGKYPRWSAFEVRRAVWQSLLSGAKAGVTYGAHGIWMFQHEGMIFNNPKFSGLPFLWREALAFEGAWDVSYAKWLFENYRLGDLEPNQKLIDGPEQARAASSRDLSRIALYMPYAGKMVIRHDLEGYRSCLHLLDSRRVLSPSLVFEKGETVLPMAGRNTDALFIAEKIGDHACHRA
ncbi:MAG: DUF4038 domain-containing protein [Treponema sp.]|jgi:hypothetical protein|nr:DUF4038 domain-containing protein [Treponema sp.]